MKYFKNTELAKLYNVSEKSVRNWIEATLLGKLDLQLHEQSGKFYIANTAKNTPKLEALVSKGKKYRNTRGYKTVTPSPEFYELFTTEQILDILANLDIHHEIPRQYNYFDGGAKYWDKFAQRLSVEETPNILNSTLELLEMNKTYLDSLIGDARHVNIVDIGVGNALPVKNVLSELLDRNILGRYIAVDISASMLKIAENNIRGWFGDKVAFEGYQRDINHERFTDILAPEYMKDDAENTINLILVLGGTLGNFRSPDHPYQIIHESMGRKDILIQTQKLDTATTRRYFDFSVDQPQALAPQHKFIVDLLSIDESYYDVEMGYDETTKARYLLIRFKVALSVELQFAGGRRTLDFNKDDSILVWRYWHQDAHDLMHQLSRNGFSPLLTSLTEDQEYVLTLSRLKCD
jgi:uncharacterized SAM-dependent methyltransferase